MKKLILLLIYSLTISTLSYADVTSDIKVANLKVSKIEKIKEDFDIITIKLLTEQLESVPPEVIFYYNSENEKLAMVHVSVGHETFLTTHTYYFQKDKALKYLKEIVGRPDNPKKEAIIYDAKGNILWKNIEKPIMSGEKLLDLFKSNMAMLNDFAKY